MPKLYEVVEVGQYVHHWYIEAEDEEAAVLAVERSGKDPDESDYCTINMYAIESEDNDDSNS